MKKYEVMYIVRPNLEAEGTKAVIDSDRGDRYLSKGLFD